MRVWKGFPEVSFLLPLGNELDIAGNDHLSANRLSDDSHKLKAEENIMNLMKEKEENQKKWKSMIVTGVISIVSFLTLIMIVAFYTEVISLTAKIIIVTIAVLIFIVGGYSVMQNERTIGYYKCANCGTLFVPTMKAYIFAVHMASIKKLKCPHCGIKKYCEKVMSKDE